MWHKLATIWKDWIEQRRKSRMASPHAIADLARELVRLSLLAQLARPGEDEPDALDEKIGTREAENVKPTQKTKEPQNADFSPQQLVSQLHILHQEMEALADMAAKPAFGRISEERRIALCERLQRSRAYLITAMHEGKPPTERIQ